MKILIALLLTITTTWAQGQDQGQEATQNQEQILEETELEPRRDDFGVPTDRELNRRILKLQDQVKELQQRVQYLESQKDMKALPFYKCTLQASLVGSFSARAPSIPKAKQMAIKECQNNSSNSALCNEANMSCSEE